MLWIALERLGRQLDAGLITQAEYDKRVLELEALFS